MRIKVCTLIDASPARVWDEIEHIERHVEWMTDAVRITFRSARQRGAGTEFECLTRVGPFALNDVLTVTEWSPRSAMGIVHEGLVTGTGRFTLRRKRGGRTRFCWEERLTFPLLLGGPLTALAAKPVLTRVWRRNLLRLKTRIETT